MVDPSSLTTGTIAVAIGMLSTIPLTIPPAIMMDIDVNSGSLSVALASASAIAPITPPSSKPLTITNNPTKNIRPAHSTSSIAWWGSTFAHTSNAEAPANANEPVEEDKKNTDESSKS